MCLRLLEKKRGGQVAVNSENTMEEIVKHVLTTMTCSVWLDCRVQERKSGHQGGRWRLRLASEFHCEYLKQQSHTGWMERGDESSQQFQASLYWHWALTESILTPSGNRRAQIFLYFQLYLTYARHVQLPGKDSPWQQARHGLVPQWSASLWMERAGSLLCGPPRLPSPFQLTTLGLSQPYIQLNLLFNGESAYFSLSSNERFAWAFLTGKAIFLSGPNSWTCRFAWEIQAAKNNVEASINWRIFLLFPPSHLALFPFRDMLHATWRLYPRWRLYGSHFHI